MNKAIQTLVVDNFQGMLTDHLFGDINSGRSWIQVSSGMNPFLKPGQLTWSDAPTQIDPTGSVITDLIVCGKERVESNILYLYAVGHTGRVYKIQVNDPTTYNPDYDNAVLLTTITINAPTFKRGGFIDFYGATEKIYIGHDIGVTSLDFSGTGEAFVGTPASWTPNVPRPLQQFIGLLCVGNGSNIAVIDSTLLVSSYTKLSPGFPANTQVRDIKLSVDGNYLQMVSSRLPLFDITSSTQETTSTADLGSAIYSWNGTDTGATASTTFPAFSLDANILFQDKQYVFGRDLYGGAIYDPMNKIIPIPESPYISPNAITSTGSAMMFMTPLAFNGVLEADLYYWGNYDFEVGNPLGFWGLMYLNATAPETDIQSVPWMSTISNNGFGASSNGYASGVYGTSKIYFSTLETSSVPTTKYRLYKWITQNSLVSPQSTNSQVGNLYGTQVQMFSKKVTVNEVRIYGDPWVANNAFTIDLIGPDSNPITGGTRTFTAGSNMTIGDDFVSYNPGMEPTYGLGILFTTVGTTNHTINKVEIDYAAAGK